MTTNSGFASVKDIYSSCQKSVEVFLVGLMMSPDPNGEEMVTGSILVTYIG